MDKATITTEMNLTYATAIITTCSGKRFEIKILKDGGEEIEISTHYDAGLQIRPIYQNKIRIK